MKLKYQQDYKSIKKFNEVELTDFTVLTGVNGSGKSHLLEAIEQKKVAIVGFEGSNNIVRFDYETFRLENEGTFSAQQITSEKEGAWTFFEQQIKNNILSWKNGLGENYQRVIDIAKNKDKSIWGLSKKYFNDDILYNLFRDSYKKIIINYFKNENLKNNQQAQAIFSLIRILSYSIDEITKENFLKLYKPFYFKNNFLPQQLGKIIWDYFVKLNRNESNEYQSSRGNSIPFLSEKDFIKQNGERPWKVINKVLCTFNNLKYKMNSPEDENLDPFGSFQLKLLHTKNEGLKINFNDLSSGEKILMALVASIYKTSSDNFFPEILLLDEIDASLHPSMMKNLLDVIDSIFLKRGIKIILVTHSPTTIALVLEESIFIMNEDGENRINKISKENALNILTDGFASLSPEESNLGISYNISKSNLPVLFTEGITDKIILETAWKNLNPTKKIPFYIQDSFDASFLGNLFKRGDDKQDGIFEVYLDRKFIALFDFDSAGYNQWNCLGKFSDNIELDPKKCLTKKHKNKKAYIMLLPVPNSDIQKQVIKCNNTFKEKSILDIELLFYGVASLNSFFKKEEEVGHGEIIRFFGKKRSFAKKISKLKKEDFENFEPIFEKIKEILDKK